MPRKLVSDELWSQIEPLLPKHKPRPKGGRPRIPDRAALAGIVFVLKTGIPWEDLPQEMGCGSGMTCWRRLRDWQEAGVWENLHHVILQNLHDMKKIDWSRACILLLFGYVLTWNVAFHFCNERIFEILGCGFYDNANPPLPVPKP